MTRKVLQIATLIALAAACSIAPTRADDLGKTSSRRTRHWNSSDSPATQSHSGGSLNDRMRAIRSGDSVAPPVSATGRSYRSVLRRPADATRIPSEPRALGSAVQDVGEPLRLGSRPARQSPLSSAAKQSEATSELPALHVSMIAPQEVLLGRPAKWQIVVRNDGDRASPPVQVTAGLPSSATVASTQASQGQVTQQAAAQRALQWQLAGLAPQAEARLTVSLVAQSAQPMRLELNWQVQTTSLSADIEVREPKLEVAVSGPAEMKYGGTAEFSVTLYNPGSGPAEDVTITVASGASRTQPQRIGTLPAGGQKTIPVDLVADRAGELEVVVVATALGGLEAQSRHRVKVRRPKLEIAAKGPRLQYAGVPATYTVQVSNRGDTGAEGTELQIDLPGGAQILAASAGAREVGGHIVWDVGELAPGTDRVFQLKCELKQSGMNVVQAAVRAEGGESATARVETQVELVADLKLTVDDPPGPQAVGQDVTYRIVVENRGSKEARGVQVYAQFSEGIEPQAAKGNEYRKVPGQIVFNKIAALAPGQRVELTVTANATVAGNHKVRVVAKCQDIETELSAEEMTKFFQ